MMMTMMMMMNLQNDDDDEDDDCDGERCRGGRESRGEMERDRRR